MVDYLEGTYNKPNLYTKQLETKVDSNTKSEMPIKTMETPQDRFIYIQAPQQKEKRGIFGSFLNGTLTAMLIFSITVAFLCAIPSAKRLIKHWKKLAAKKNQFKETNPAILQVQKLFKGFDRNKFNLDIGYYDLNWRKLKKVPDKGAYISVSKGTIKKEHPLTCWPNGTIVHEPPHKTNEASITFMVDGTSKLSIGRILEDNTETFYIF